MEEGGDHDDGEDEDADGLEAGAADGVEVFIAVGDEAGGLVGWGVVGVGAYVVVVQTMAVERKSRAAVEG